MKKVLLLSIVVFLCVAGSSRLYAQPDIAWSHMYGGSGDELLYKAVQTSDGGFILGAQTNSRGAGSHDYWLIKTNSMGDTLWTRTFGGSQPEWIGRAGETSDGGYYAFGSSWSFGPGGENFWLVRTDANGTLLWSRAYGGPQDDQGYWCQQTPDGGFILAGYTFSFGVGGRDWWIVKTDANGDSMWSRTFGGAQHDGCVDVSLTEDGGYLLSGITRSYGDPDGDFCLFKVDANGDSMWSHTYGNQWEDLAWSAKQTWDGGYVVAGRTNRSNGMADVLLIKTDANGDSLWGLTYGFAGSGEAGISVIQTDDWGFAVTGQAGTITGGDVLLLRTDSGGNILWTRAFGGSLWDEAYDIIRLEDNSFLISAVTRSWGALNQDAWLIKTNPDVGALPGGEICGNATVIPGLPFKGHGFNSANANDYNFQADPWGWPDGANDVVYQYSPPIDQCLDVALCSSTYDTRLIIYDESCAGNPIAFSDDGCLGPNYDMPYVSLELGVEVNAGQTYYFVIDGFDGTSVGDYEIEVSVCTPFVAEHPCPDDVIYGQPPYNDVPLLTTSDWNQVYDWTAFDNVTLAGEDVCGIGFWGTTAQYNGIYQSPCTDSELNFDITFYQDNGQGSPGTVLQTYTLTPTREIAYSLSFPGYDWTIYYYFAPLTPCFTHIGSCWMSVRASVGSNSNCVWHWQGSPIEDQQNWFGGSQGWYKRQSDFAFCLYPTLSADPNPAGVAAHYALHQNYPNPFNSATTLAYDVPAASHISLRVFDLLGREVAELTDGMKAAGSYRVAFNGENLASGIYFARLDAGEFSQTKKLVLLK